MERLKVQRRLGRLTNAWDLPLLVAVLTGTTVLVALIGSMFLLIYAVNYNPAGDLPDNWSLYLHRAEVLFVIAAVVAALDGWAMHRARKAAQARPEVVLLDFDPGFRRALLTQRVSLRMALGAIWLTVTTVSTVMQSSWAHRALAVCAAALAGRALVIGFRRQQRAEARR